MLSRIQLRTVDDALYSGPPESETVVHAIYLSNTSASLRRFRLHHTLPGESSVAANALFYDVAIPANSTYVDDTRILVRGGEELRGLADGTGVSVTLYGLRSR